MGSKDRILSNMATLCILMEYRMFIRMTFIAGNSRTIQRTSFAYIRFLHF